MRRHTVILGAGATIAAIPNGDKNGNKSSVMNGLIDKLNLNDVLSDVELSTTSNNLEDIYSELYSKLEYKNVVNESFALSYELSFKTVADVNAADFTMAKVAPGKSQIGVIKVQEQIDPNKTHPLTCGQIVDEVNKELTLKRITFTPISDKAKSSFTTSTFNTLNTILKFKDDCIFTYKHKVGKNISYTYSTKLVQKIINTFIDNPDILRSIKKR